MNGLYQNESEVGLNDEESNNIMDGGSSLYGKHNNGQGDTMQNLATGVAGNNGMRIINNDSDI